MMNDLHGGAMREYLPYGGFKWVKITNEIVNRIFNKKDNGLHGYFFEVGLDYPELIPNLITKNDYIVHYRNLKYYLSKGLALTKMHRILEFKQSDWMKPCIHFNTQKRKEGANEADKTLFKLLNNAVYGKTMENMRKRIKIRIIKNVKDFIKYAPRPTYINHNIFGKRLVAIHEKKKNY